METLYFDDKISAIEAFYQGKISVNWIARTPVKWVVYSLYEKELSPTFTPGPELVYQNKTVLIYNAFVKNK